jgi:hypothetical protein
MVDKQYNKLCIVKSGDDTVDIIYKHLIYQDFTALVCCFVVSKVMRECVVGEAFEGALLF